MEDAELEKSATAQEALKPREFNEVYKVKTSSFSHGLYVYLDKFFLPLPLFLSLTQQDSD